MSCSCCQLSLKWLSYKCEDVNSTHERNRGFGIKSPSVLRGFAFGSVMLASSAMNNLFVTYHLDFFLTVVHLSPFWFYLGHSVFMVWNAVNDLIFGWLSDTLFPKSLRRSRLPTIRYCGGIWALIFFFVWFPWGGPHASPMLAGLNWMANLCLYDSMLTLVEVNHSALLAEVTTDSRERAQLNSFSSLCAALGSLTSLAGHLFWFQRGGDMAPFRRFAAFVAIASFGCFQFAAFYLRSINVGKAHDGGKYRSGVEDQRDSVILDDATVTKYMFRSTQRPSARSGSMTSSTDILAMPSQGGDDPHNSSPVNEKRRFLDFIWALSQQTNFVIFAGVAAIQTFDCALGKNFFVLFLDCLVGNALSPQAHGVVLTASFLLPWLAAAALSRVLERTNVTLAGLLRSVWLARLTFLTFCIMLLAMASYNGGGSAILWRSDSARRVAAVVVLLNRVMSETVCRLVPLVESDLIDEHRYLSHPANAANQGKKRDSPSLLSDSSASSRAASLVGTAHFLSKPSVSLGPMVGYSLLSRAAPHLRLFAQNAKASGDDLSAAISPTRGSAVIGGMDGAFDGMGSGSAMTVAQQQAVEWVVLVVPFTCVIIQLALWQQFHLRGKYLASVKRFLLAIHDEASV